MYTCRICGRFIDFIENEYYEGSCEACNRIITESLNKGKDYPRWWVLCVKGRYRRMTDSIRGWLWNFQYFHSSHVARKIGKKHNCDGCCHSTDGKMCHRASWCPEFMIKEITIDVIVCLVCLASIGAITLIASFLW